MKLNILKRIQITNILPQKGTLTEQVICRDITEKVSIKQPDIEDFEIKALENGGLSWNKEKEKDIEIEFSAPEINILKDAVKKLDNNKEITIYLIDLCNEINAL